MKQIVDIEVPDNKKVILRDIIDYDNNVVYNNISEDRKLKITKLNEEFNNILRKGKLEVSIGN